MHVILAALAIGVVHNVCLWCMHVVYASFGTCVCVSACGVVHNVCMLCMDHLVHVSVCLLVVYASFWDF